MSSYNKVVWSEGLFLRPQHFQQQDRYFERYVESRCHALTSHAWGFTRIEIDSDLLRIGRLALRTAAGVFPDGTPFRMPEDTPLPAPLEVGPDVRDAMVSLAVPLRRLDALDVERDHAHDRLVRHDVAEIESRDVTSLSTEPALLEVGAVRTSLLLDDDVTAAWAAIPLTRIVEARADRQVVLDTEFIATALDAHAVPRLAAWMTEALGLLRHQGELLAGRVTATGRGASAEMADFLTLQVINRLDPLFAHLGDSGVLHPEALYRVCVSAAGELSTFVAPSKRSPVFPPYRHERLRESFDPVIARLRELITAVRYPAATPVAVEAKKFGLHVATVADRSLYTSSTFVLVARADLPAEEMRRRFPSQLKVGPVERIRDLVNLQLPGLPVQPVPVAPRQLPYHAGSVYFEFDGTHELFAALQSSGGIGMHVVGEFPGLKLELWAIRN